MDARKRDDLKAKLSSQPEFQVVPIDVFFDGNDDEASIGCNLIEHPGINVFHRVLLGLLGRADVVAVYAQISEVDPGEECWPFADRVFVVGTIPQHELADALAPLAARRCGSARIRSSRGDNTAARCAGLGRVVGLSLM